jgi:hypothetical protein
MGEIDVPCPFAPRARGDRRFQGVLSLTFLLDSASAFLAKHLLVRFLLRARQNESIPSTAGNESLQGAAFAKATAGQGKSEKAKTIRKKEN